MTTAAPTVARLDLPTHQQSEAILDRQRQMFHRTLSGWASDLLAYQARERHRVSPIRSGRRDAA
jgi:hypothetical protein